MAKQERLSNRRLSASDVEAIARRVLDLASELTLLRGTRYVDAATLAELLSVERDWIYAHSAELGAVRLGGPTGRLRFDVEFVDRILAATRPQTRAPARRLPKEQGARFQRAPLLDYER